MLPQQISDDNCRATTSLHANQKSKEQQELCVLIVLLLTFDETMLHLGHPSQQMALSDGQHQASLWKKASDPDTVRSGHLHCTRVARAETLTVLVEV